MKISVRNSYEAPVNGADITVFFDIFRASTTLVTLASKHPDIIVSSNHLPTIRNYQESGYRLLSEVYTGDFDNSPTQVMSESWQGRKVIHSSTNLTNSIFGNRDFHHGLIGCFHNIEALTDYIVSRRPQHVELIACSHFARRTVAIEDMSCAMLCRSRLLALLAVSVSDSGLQPSLSLMGTPNIPDQEGIRAKIADKEASATYPAYRINDLRYCMELKAVPVVLEIQPRSHHVMEIASVRREPA